MNTQKGNPYYIPRAKITDYEFGILNEEQILGLSVAEVKTPYILDNNKKPYETGPCDLRMGTTDFSFRCNTCQNKKGVCVGHSGHIELHYPIKQPIFIDLLVRTLRQLCLNCSRVLFGAKNCDVCRVSLDEIKVGRNDRYIINIVDSSGTSKRLHNHVIVGILNKINNEDAKRLGFKKSHPRDLMISRIYVPENTVRPNAILGGDKSKNKFDNITVIIQTLVKLNKQLEGLSVTDIVTKYIQVIDTIEVTYSSIVRGGTSNSAKIESSVGHLSSIKDIITGKPGKIRQTLVGKKIMKVGRDVIGCDPLIPIDEVHLTVDIAGGLYIYETVTEYNHERLGAMLYNDEYPRIKFYIKRTGEMYNIRHCRETVRLEHGDRVYRNVVDGDWIVIHRFPTLLISNMTAHRIRVNYNGSILSFNPLIICACHNADFDGDVLNMYVCDYHEGQTDMRYIMNIQNLTINSQGSTPIIGAFHDSIIGAYLMTRYSGKIHPLLGNYFYNNTKIYTKFTDPKTTREVLSKSLPSSFNYSSRKTSFNKPYYTENIKYGPTDGHVVVKNGEIEQGILDKGTTGQKVHGSIFHNINMDYGAQRGIDVLFDYQQTIIEFMNHYGFTVSMRGFDVKTEGKQIIDKIITDVLNGSNEIVDKLITGQLTPPISMNIKEYYEQMQLGTLTFGDKLISTILKYLKYYDNTIIELIISGSKGNPNNFSNVNGAIGQLTLNGARFSNTFGIARSNIYSHDFDFFAECHGFITGNYKYGIRLRGFFTGVRVSRESIVRKALTTSVSGEFNRYGVGNMQTCIVNNLSQVLLGNIKIQYTYGLCSFDPRRVESVVIGTIFISNVELKEYMSKSTDFGRENKQLDKLLAQEFMQLVQDREWYRECMFATEQTTINNNLLKNVVWLPINIEREAQRIQRRYEGKFENDTFDPEFCINQVTELCNSLPKTFVDIDSNVELPDYIVDDFKIYQIYVRSVLTVKNIKKMGLTNNMLRILYRAIITKTIRAYIYPGTCIGILCAQNIFERLTQYVLDSHHRSSSTGTNVSIIGKINDIISVKTVDKMMDPRMFITINDKYSREACDEFAKKLESIKLKSFITGDVDIFFDGYGSVVHPDFLNDKHIFDTFTQYAGSPPSDLTQWCIRFELSHEKIIIKGITLDKIIYKLKSNTNIYTVYTDENSPKIILRIYIRTGAFLGDVKFNTDGATTIANDIINTTVSGVADILSATVTDMIETYKDDDGSLKTRKYYTVTTSGINIPDVAVLDGIANIDFNNIVLKAKMFGIEVARKTIVDMMLSAMSETGRDTELFAEVMCCTGIPTNMDRYGNKYREKNNILGQAALGTPFKTFQDAAEDGTIAKVDVGVYPPLMAGAEPHTLGTYYNSIIMNTTGAKNNIQLLDEL